MTEAVVEVKKRGGMLPELRVMVDTRTSIQKLRIGMGNRIRAIQDGEDESDPLTLDTFLKLNDRFEEMEEELDTDIKSYAKEFPIINEMVAVKGISFILAAKVVSMIDIHRSSTVSALWKFAGYGVSGGEADRRRKGEKLAYNSRLKVTVFLCGESFIRSSSPYRDIYDSAKEFYEANRDEWTKLHIHRAAMRKMVKVWLSHLWIIWRQLEDLPINQPFAQDKLGHDSYKKPEDFGWTYGQPKKAKKKKAKAKK